MQQLRTQGAIDLENHARPNKPQRSRFNLSRTINLTAEPGMIIPVDIFPVLPGDDLDIDTEMIMDTLPLAAPSLTRYKVTVHWYYMKARDTWKGFKSFWTRGRTGKLTDKVVPTIDTDLILKKLQDWNNKGPCSIFPRGYHSLKAFLTGFPDSLSGCPTINATEENMILRQYLPYILIPETEGNYRTAYINAAETGHKHLTSGTSNAKINAMPFVMYQSIVKNNYVNENLLQDNQALFPEEGDDDWILPYNATTVNFIGRGEINNDDWNNGTPSDADDWKFDWTGVFHNDDTRVRLDLLRYAMFDDDYFTSGLPWLQRGEAKTLDVDITGIEIDTKLQSPYEIDAVGGREGGQSVGVQSENGKIQSQITETDYTGRLYLNGKTIANTLKAEGAGQTTLTTNALREMIAMQVWMERNARVNGSYNMMTYQHWLVNPESEEHKPIYFGGSVEYVQFTNVIQNSESTENAPLGTTAGFGTAGGSSKVGHIYCKDYGYVMGILIIRQNTQYTQGFEHFWRHEQVFEQMVQPEFQGLSPEPIYNDEIYISGDANEDKGLFCYQERFQYLKQRINANRGLFTAAPTKDRLFSAYTQARWFESKPTFSYQFLVMSPDNIRRDMLAYPNYPMFRIQFATKAYVTRELAYASEPNTFGF